MILAFAAKGKKTIACVMLALIYLEAVIPAYALGRGRTVYRVGETAPVKKRTAVLPVGEPAPAATPRVATGKAPSPAVTAKGTGGPTQPEMEAFHSVNSDNMVDLFTGNFSYNIPLMDVGGYPIGLGYSSGISMDDEASWTGLGWNINPGTITRNMRGVPDDFNGTDQVTKTVSVNENKTVGGSLGLGAELFGFDLKSVPVGFKLSATLGVFHNTYRGWGMDASIGCSVDVGSKGAGSLTGGMSLSNSTQDGVSISPSLEVRFKDLDAKEKGGYSGHISTGLSYNTRGGMRALQFSAGVAQYRQNEKKEGDARSGMLRRGDLQRSTNISFAYPASTPAISLPYTNKMFTGKSSFGFELVAMHPTIHGSGYVLKQYIADADRVQTLPAYGYLHYDEGATNNKALMDYNRERELPEKEDMKSLAVPSYTYDVFSISGEGTGGMFRAYRSDIGFVFDHYMKTRDNSTTIGVDLGYGNLLHGGGSLDMTYANTETGPWWNSNPLGEQIGFTTSNKKYEAVYFKNPGEQSINPREYYETLGGDDIVMAELTGGGTPNITTTNNLHRYRKGAFIGKLPLATATAKKPERDKRTQLITYLNAEEASSVGLSRFIENYKENKYVFDNCSKSYAGDPDLGAYGFAREGFETSPTGFVNYRPEPPSSFLKFDDVYGLFYNTSMFREDGVMEWRGADWKSRLKAPVTGVYDVNYTFNDAIMILVNGTRFSPGEELDATKWTDDQRGEGKRRGSFRIALEKGKIYDVEVIYFNSVTSANIDVQWTCNGTRLTGGDFYLPSKKDTFVVVTDTLVKEQRVNDIRKPHHMSEIDVLNENGQKYVYGLPVYNLKQKEVTFSADYKRANATEGTVNYNSVTGPYRDDDVTNNQGNEHYYSSEELPPYAHSFLLTGILSPDYVDMTGDGITDDDAGSAVKFNYTKTAGKGDPYKWRTPYTNSATFNEGLKTDHRDDKGSYIYGEKELWYLNSIESKNMLATFKLGDRDDLLPINQDGTKIKNSRQAKRLEEINLYVKADYLRDPTKAKPVKTVHFEYSYELCPGVNLPESPAGKLTLKKVWFSYNGNVSKTNTKRAQQNAYIFNYNSNNPTYNSKSFDRWGNYKQPTENPGSSTDHLIPNTEYPYALQDSSIVAKNAAAWTLDSIILPSGGRMKVTYEGDDYAYVQNRRAAKMTRIAGFSKDRPQSMEQLTNHLYDWYGVLESDHLYIAFDAAEPVGSNQEVYTKYLSELHDTIYFRLNVKMPEEKGEVGNEYVPCYALLDASDYGYLPGGKTIYIKVKPIKANGADGGQFSPLASSAVQFLRLNLPSKAFPGSEVESMDGLKAITMVIQLGVELPQKLMNYNIVARSHSWAQEVDLSRSHARLCDPSYKKYGGGIRVKRIVIYDNWNAMTGKKESMYGTEYSYTTTKKIDGVDKEISSGVATYEPILGGEENPWHTPVMYRDKVAALAPVTSSYVETPFGEAFFPSASVGYSKVRTRPIKIKNTRSASGFDESCFYTSYDFPTIVEFSELSPEVKMRFRPKLQGLVHINSRYYLALSQGFKIELNDMHGKLRSKSSYADSSAKTPIASTTYYYKVVNENATFKHLDNEVLTIDKSGQIKHSLIGKDVELMMDMRQQIFRSVGADLNVDGDGFMAGALPLTYLSLIPMPMSEENIFRSAATTKVINCHGILDRVEVIDKGSKVVTRNMLYDSETGDVLLTATQNEFGDSIYQFSYPAAWAYDGMSGAYKNINTTVTNITVTSGKITGGLSDSEINDFFTSGDELLTYSRNKVAGSDCNPIQASFPTKGKLWAIDANVLKGGAPNLFFITEDGTPFTGKEMTMKVIRSGRKNISASMGSVTMMKNPLVAAGNNYVLQIDKSRNIINAAVTEYKQNWHVEDNKKSVKSCAYQQ